jgi:hypothetical protein
MLKKLSLALLASVVLAQPVLAHDMMSEDSSCAPIAKACIDAGYKGDATDDKHFWFDCMKPVLLGKTVENVTVDAAVLKKCRAEKIKKMTKELNELKKVK